MVNIGMTEVFLFFVIHILFQKRIVTLEKYLYNVWVLQLLVFLGVCWCWGAGEGAGAGAYCTCLQIKIYL